MAKETVESNGSRESEGKSEQPDFKWAVEYLVRERGQRHAAKLLGVNRKTVALALRRDRLTARMNHAVQTFIARADDHGGQKVMPLDRMQSQIGFLLESMDELDRLVERLTQRVEALEEAQARLEADVETDEDAPVELGGGGGARGATGRTRRGTGDATGARAGRTAVGLVASLGGVAEKAALS